MSEKERMIPEEYAKRALEEQREYYEDKLKEKPNSLSWFTLGFSIATLIVILFK